MTSLTSDGISLLSFIGLVVGWRFVASIFYWRQDRMRKAELRSKVRSIRDKQDAELTFADAVSRQLEIHEGLTPRGDDTIEKRNAMWADMLLEYELGHYVNKPISRDLNDTQRDILIANARKDAAEALANSRALLKEVSKLIALADQLWSALFWLSLLAMVVLFFKTGFAPR